METHYKFGYANVGAMDNLSDFGFKFLDEGYDDKTIRNIYDSYAGRATDIPVSVPSPFAILSLVKTAFDNACELIINKDDKVKIIEENGKERLEHTENKNHNVLICRDDMLNVFNTLDLAELTFHGIVNYIELGQDTIDTLKKEISDERHINLGTVLDEYKKLDGDIFGLKDGKENFKFYLLKYGPNVIGGSSKATLFFPTRNNDLLKKVATSLNTKFPGRSWFDHDHIVKDKISGTYQSITEILSEDFVGRDFEFKKWIVQLLADSNTSIGKYIKNVRGEDIDGQNIRLNIGQWRKDYNPQNKLTLDNIGEIIQNRIDEIMGIRVKEDEELKRQKLSIIDRADISEDYKSILRESLDSMNKKELEDRISKIKIQGIFADYIVKVHYDKVSDHFKVLELDGSYYLPPLNQNANYSCDNIELKYRPENKSEIEIFLKGTQYKKTYGNQVHRDTGLGQIVQGNFNVALFPFVSNAEEYRAQLVERADSEAKANLKNKDNGGHDFFERRKIDLDKGNDVRTIYVNLENPVMNFQMRYDRDDFNIRLEPRFKPVNIIQNANFSFAVDFGTTNTHISYRLGNAPPKTFDLDNYIATLKDMSQDKELETFHIYLDAEFLPLKIGDKYSFPLRTILSSDEEAARQNRNTNIVRKVFKDIGVYNIPFGYGSLEMFGYKYHPNLKWHKENDEYKHFLREIGLLLYTKVILEGGSASLPNTKIYFSYPLSLGDGPTKKLKVFWTEFYEKFFLSKDTSSKEKRIELASQFITEVPESYAPVLYYLKHRQALADIQDKIVLCVDIGGGTTDCAALIREDDNGKMEDKMVLQSSFRFASSSIFGGTIDMATRESAYNFNHLTEKYIDIYMKDGEGDAAGILKKIKHGTTGKMYGNRDAIFKDIVEKNNSNEINSCLFSFDSTTFKDQDDRYVEKLKNDDSYKIVFLYYFSVIVYHLAKLLEKKYNGTKVPPLSEIIFSGNGSKVLDILDFSLINKDVLRKIVQDIFSEVKVLNLTEECKEVKLRFDPTKSKVLTAEGSLMPIDVKQCEATEIYGKFLNKDNKAETDEIKALFESFNKIFLKIVEGKLDSFQIKPKSFKKFKETIDAETRNIFTLVNTMAITQSVYGDAMDREEYVESPMIPFEMMIFTLFRSLS
jgi:hypothetical protein